MSKKPLEIDMCAGSQLRDTQGETLSIEGADISELEAGRGRFNDNHGKGFFNSIGRVTEAKKIFKADDCSTDRQKYYWEKVKAPYIYVKGVLYDDEDHPNAKAAAAILRNIHKSDCPLKIKASVEGGILQRGIKDPRSLTATKIHSLALTFTPANNATLVEPLTLSKSTEPGDEELIRSVQHLAQDWDSIPSFRLIERTAYAQKIHSNLNDIVDILQKITPDTTPIAVPTPQEILKSAMTAKIQNNINKISQITDELSTESLDKGMKQTIAGLALAGSLLAPGKLDVPKPPTAKSPTAIVEQSKASDPHLWSIAQLESKGGQNMQHKQVTTGVHNGHNAGGPWGMMPHTVRYVMKQDPNLRTKYPNLFNQSNNVEKHHSNITNTLNTRPDIAHDLASSLMNHLRNIHGGDMNKVIHSWRHGILGTKKAESKKAPLQDSKYNSAFWKVFNKLTPSTKPVEKALTAGYGGAGAPTDRTAGAVMQTEALEDGRPSIKQKGFKYVTCDQCGNEQVYMKHQVKCRSCNHPLRFEKLLRVMFE
jgi:hypothetical protein